MQKSPVWAVCFLAGACLLPSAAAHAQAPPAAPATAPAAPARLVGSLVKVDGQKLTLKDEKGTESTVTLTDATRLLQIAPGQSSLAGARPIELSGMQPGDRLLVRVQASPDGGLAATVVVAMKQADIAQQHATETEAWQHGVGGLVKSVDTASSAIVVTTGTGGSARQLTIKLASKAVVKRYAPESVQFALAQPSSLDRIMAGDQVRARGTAGGTPAEFVADEVIAGSFRNLSGKITAVDASSGMVGLTDLATRQAVQLKVTADSQLRKLDDATAEKLAAAMKPAAAMPGSGAAGGPAGAAPASTLPGGTAAPSGHSGPPSGMPAGAEAHRTRPDGGASPGASNASDMQQALAHAAPIHIGDLKKGDLVMAVASSGADSQYGAVTLVTGVEPLLRASPNASAAGLSSWSLGAGGGAGGGEQ